MPGRGPSGPARFMRRPRKDRDEKRSGRLGGHGDERWPHRLHQLAARGAGRRVTRAARVVFAFERSLEEALERALEFAAVHEATSAAVWSERTAFANSDRARFD